MNFWKLSVLLFAISLIVQFGHAAAQNLETELQLILDAELAKPNRFGASLHVDINGLGSWTVAGGTVDVNSSVSPNLNSKYRVGSITKTFVSALILHLVDRGDITLETPIESILPGLLPNGSNITFRHLLSHTSGLKDHIDDSNNLIELTLLDDLAFRWSPQDLIDIAVNLGPASNPGDSFHYSNTGYVVLGLAIEEITGKPLAIALDEILFEPLRLGNTSVSWDTSAADPELRAYAILDDQSTLDVTELSRSFMFGAGGIASTTTDLARWFQLLLRGQVISTRLLTEMMETVDSGRGYGYGLGFMELQTEIFNLIGHGGGGFGYRSEMWYSPELETTIITMANSIEFETGEVVIEALSLVDQMHNSGALVLPKNSLDSLDSPTTTLGSPTTAVFLGSAFPNGSSVAKTEFFETEPFDVIANIRVESGHIAKSGNVYVIVLLANGDAYAKDSSGNFYLLEKDFSNLSAFEESIQLPPSKNIVVFENLTVGKNSGLAGSNVDVIVGYSLNENLNEIYYHGKPIRITIVGAP